MTIWTLERNIALRERVSAGFSPAQIAEELGVNELCVRRKIACLHREIPFETVQRIIECWKVGMSYKAVGRLVGLKPAQVKNVIGRLNLTIKRERTKKPPKEKYEPKRWTQEHDRLLIEKRKADIPIDRCAQELGFAKSTIKGHIKRLGIKKEGRENVWPEERLERLRNLFREGKTPRAIADELETTRNAIIGKLNRLGLCAPRLQAVATVKPQGPITRITNYFPKSTKYREVYDDLPQEYDPNAVPMMELKGNQCRWPKYGEGMNLHCCGKQKVPGFPYCEEHKGRAYRSARNQKSLLEFYENSRSRFG